MIAEFPRFTPIGIDLLSDFNSIVRHHPPYSDFNFVNLMCWNRTGTGAISRLHDNLVLYFPSYVDDGHFVSFIGSNESELTAEKLFKIAAGKFFVDKLSLVPETAAEPLKTAGRWHAEVDKDNTDYVISLGNISKMQGGKFRRLRRAVNFFAREYGDKSVLRQLDLSDTATQLAVIDIFIKRETQKWHNESAHELSAIWQLLKHAHYFKLLGYGLEVEGRLCAFIICEDVGNGCAIGHFWKADIKYKGIYSYLMYQAAHALTSVGIGIMNIQQDLGIDSLRFFKSSFCPILQLKKYTISPGLV